MIYVAGYLGNAMRRATSFTPSQAAHAKYPATNLGSGLPSKPFRFNAVGANVAVVADINFLLNQGLENWLVTTLPDDWVEGAGAGTIAREAGTVDEGTYSAKISGAKEFYQDVDVLTGKEYELGAALHGDGAQGAYIYIQDLDTLKWLNTSAAWQVAKTHAEIETTDAWDDEQSNFTVESPSNAKYYTTLRIFCAGEVGGVVFVDDLYLIPKVSTTSVHGHNLGSGVALNLRASTDNFAASNVNIATPVMAQPAFYKTFTEVAYRYWKLLTTSQAVGDPIWMGEWVLGPYNTLGRQFAWDWQTIHRQPRIAVQMSPSGQLYSRNEAYRPGTDLRMNWKTPTEADRDEILEEICQASEWGDEPVIIVPLTTDELVIHGRVGDVFEYSSGAGPLWRYSMDIGSDAFPVAGF